MFKIISTKAYSEPYQTFKMELLAKIVHDFHKKLHLRCLSG